MSEKANTAAKLPDKVKARLCPVCTSEVYVKVYGPFFTPELTYRYAMTCAYYGCWRGRMYQTKQEALTAEIDP